MVRRMMTRDGYEGTALDRDSKGRGKKRGRGAMEGLVGGDVITAGKKRRSSSEGPIARKGQAKKKTAKATEETEDELIGLSRKKRANEPPKRMRVFETSQYARDAIKADKKRKADAVRRMMAKRKSKK